MHGFALKISALSRHLRRRRRETRHRLLGFDVLEERTLLAANLSLTRIELTNGAGNQISSPAVGQEVIVRATFETFNISSSSEYEIAFVLDGQIALTQTLSLGAGQTSGTWQVTKRGWFATIGGHTMSVTLDAAGAVAESSEATRCHSTETGLRRHPAVRIDAGS